MASRGIDDILNKLSGKFKRIFYDREFVACVVEDLQTILENKNKCCVLVFPILGPNYLRVVRYQAKLLDLGVISLGSGSAKSVGVCHKKYFVSNPSEAKDSTEKEHFVKQMADNSVIIPIRKKRPAIQLYVPPAQRKSKLSETNNTQKESIKDLLKDESCQKVNTDKEKEICTLFSNNMRKEESPKEDSGILKHYHQQVDKEDIFTNCFCLEDFEHFLPNVNFSFQYFSERCTYLKCALFKSFFPFSKLLIFSLKKLKHPFQCSYWHQKTWNILIKDDRPCLETRLITNIYRQLFGNINENSRTSLVRAKMLDFQEFKDLSEEGLNEYQNKLCLCGNNLLVDILSVGYSCYLSSPEYELFDSGLRPQDILHCYLYDKDGSLDLDECIKCYTNTIILPILSSLLEDEDIDVSSLLIDKMRTESPQMPASNGKDNCDNEIRNICAKSENTNELSPTTKSVSLEKVNFQKKTETFIVLDERIDPPFSDNSLSINSSRKSTPRIKEQFKRKDNEHEQEKEIMRKTKQNINRKTRPIIKYVEDDNDTLKIGKADNVNNWEDLFNEEGELEEDIFTEIIQKVGPEVKIVRATEDYSAYAAKQIGELEHMVELYDFPPTLETCDIISAFSELKTDSMYIKWIDDTHALLILGSSLQAQKAVEISNPLIKVRPMSAASNIALEKANLSELKPAMKRPQTNLQTARRLITSHLGAKSRVSKEQSAKEREDLRVAKEMKKQAKQNEKDAWEGNLRSANN